MKILIALLLVSLPAAAQAYAMSGGGFGSCEHAGSALYAALAALGYWVLQRTGKDTVNYVKMTGVVLGMTLVVIGLLGLLCGVGSHMKKGARFCASGQGAMMQDGPEGRP